MDLFKEPVDNLANDWQTVRLELRIYFFNAKWYEVYDFLEFVVNNFPTEPLNAQFLSRCNAILEREMAAYRFVDRRIIPIIDEVEVEAIEAACHQNGLAIALGQH